MTPSRRSTPENRKDDAVALTLELFGNVDAVGIQLVSQSLTALGCSIRESNDLIFPGSNPLEINVKPFRRGSFGIDTLICVAVSAQQALGSDPISQTMHVLEAIGLIKSKVTSVVKVLRELRGIPASSKQQADRVTEYTRNDRSIVVKGDVNVLLKNSSLTHNIYNIYATAAKSPSVEGVRSYLKNKKRRSRTVELPIREIQQIAPSHGEISSAASPTLMANERVSVQKVNPRRGPFNGEKRAWSFSRGDAAFKATVTDTDFLAKCESGEIRLNIHDLLEVELVEKVKREGTNLGSSFEVRRVISYQKAEQPRRLPFNDTPRHR